MLRECGKVGPLLRVLLVFTCDLRGLLFLCPCQPWSTVNCKGDPVDEDSLPNRDLSVSQGFNEPFLVLGTWLGGSWPWNHMETGHVPLGVHWKPDSPNRSEGPLIFGASSLQLRHVYYFINQNFLSFNSFSE